MKDKISIIEYLNILQKEWVQFFWARNVFPKRYNKKYDDLMSDRKEKIIDITRKIMVSNIFDDISTLESVFDSIFKVGDVPEFLYRNSDTCDKIHHFNMVYFYVNKVVDFNGESYTVSSLTPDLKQINIGAINTDKISKVFITDVKHNFNFEDFTKWL